MSFPSQADYRARNRYLDLAQVAVALGDASLDDDWRGPAIVPVQDGTSLQVSELRNAVGHDFPDVPDFNAVSSGSYTVGSGGDYATWSAAIADVAAPLTGDLTFTQISDTTETAGINITKAVSSYTFTLDSDDPHLGNPIGGHEILVDHTANPAVALSPGVGAGDTGTLDVKNLRLRANQNTSNANMITAIASANGTAQWHDLMLDNNGSQRAGLGTAGNGTIDVWNVVSWESDANGISVQAPSSGLHRIENCTSIDCDAYGFSANISSALYEFRNLVAVNNTVSDFRPNNPTVRINLASTDGTAGGTSPETNIITGDEFESLSDASADFMKLKAGGVLDDSGASAAVSGNTNGIRGNARPGSDSLVSRGADEIVTATGRARRSGSVAIAA